MNTSRYESLLELDYENVMTSCAVNPDSRRICEDPVFWQDKAERDFNRSISEVREVGLSPREKYLVLASANYTRDVNTSLNIEERLIEATGDKELFDNLKNEYPGSIYSNPNLVFLVLISAINKENELLIREIAPEASEVIVDIGQRHDILFHTANTGDEDLVLYVYDYFNEGDDVNDWLIQAALVRGNKEYAEVLIKNYLQRRKYTRLAYIFIRSGDLQRFESLLALKDLNNNEQDIREIFFETIRRNQLKMTQLILSNEDFTQYLNREDIAEAIDLSTAFGYTSLKDYLETFLD